MRLLRVLLLALAPLLITPSASASDFGRMFPSLPGFTSPSQQQLADLAQTMLDPNRASGDNTGVPSGFTYGGQFLDHDLTLDLIPIPTSPTNAVGTHNARTFKLDLDSVYGGGPAMSPQLYQADGVHFRIGSSFGQVDLPRNADGSAILVEHRNDENEIISQIHTAFLLAHNRLVDDGLTFTQARSVLVHAWQHIVLGEYLPAVLGQQAVTAALARPSAAPGTDPMTPLEFSVAAFRFGHSEVRRSYNISDRPDGTARRFQVFSGDDPDLRGGRPLPANRLILWGYFFDQLTEEEDIDERNQTRRIDPLISIGLFRLPIPGAEATGSNVLVFRSLSRAKFYGLPSYEAVARQLGITPVGAPVFRGGTPLLYGILRESQRVNGGLVVGPTGGRIIADTIISVLRADSASILNGNEGPTPPPALVGADGEASFADLLVYAGVAEFPE